VVKKKEREIVFQFRFFVFFPFVFAAFVKKNISFLNQFKHFSLFNQSESEGL